MSTKPSVIAPVVKTVTVECTPQEAFRYFTTDFDKWWPLATHSLIAFSSEFKKKPVSAIFEQHLGGRIIYTKPAELTRTYRSLKIEPVEGTVGLFRGSQDALNLFKCESESLESPPLRQHNNRQSILRDIAPRPRGFPH